MWEQINAYFKTILSKVQCSFQKVYRMQHSLILLIEFTKLLIAKMHIYGFHIEHLKLIIS